MLTYNYRCIKIEIFVILVVILSKLNNVLIVVDMKNWKSIFTCFYQLYCLYYP